MRETMSRKTSRPAMLSAVVSALVPCARGPCHRARPSGAGRKNSSGASSRVVAELRYRVMETRLLVKKVKLIHSG